MNIEELDNLLARAKAQSENPPLISIQQVAKQYDISVRTLRRLEAKELMPARTKLGRRKMYKKTDIARMMAARQARRPVAV